MKLLVIEDSERLRNSLVKGLSKLGFPVDGAANGKEGLSKAFATNYDVIILDLMLPVMDGFTVLKKIRSAGVPSSILILSAKSFVDDKVKGLNMGADDYLSKPFEFDELHARLKNIIRKNNSNYPHLIKHKGMSINLSIKEVMVDDERIHFTPIEYSLLEYLVLKKGMIVSFDQLENALYKGEKYIYKNTIEAHISSLRKKLVCVGISGLIKTKRGFGYYIGNNE